MKDESQDAGSTYTGHVYPFSNSSNYINQNIIFRLSELSISLEKLEAIGCDRSMVNAGRKDGVIHRLESYVGRPL